MCVVREFENVRDDPFSGDSTNPAAVVTVKRNNQHGYAKLSLGPLGYCPPYRRSPRFAKSPSVEVFRLRVVGDDGCGGLLGFELEVFAEGHADLLGF